MKKGKAVKTLCICTVAVIVVTCYSLCTWSMTHYTKQANVVEVNDTIITVVDGHGNLWTFEGTDYQINDKVLLTMHTSYTDSNIFDDTIESVKLLEE